MIKYLLSAVFFSLTFCLSAQVLTGKKAYEKIKGCSEIHYTKNEKVPILLEISSIDLDPNLSIWTNKTFSLSSEYSLQLQSSSKDKLGYDHEKYQQLYKGIPIEGSVYIKHCKKDEPIVLTGHLTTDLTSLNDVVLNEDKAFMKAVKFIGAEKYLWESNQNQTIENKISIPKAQQVIIKTDDDSKNYRLAYKFDIYAVKPLNRSFVYVDAETGLILKSVNRICYVGNKPHVHGSSCNNDHIENIETTNADALGTANTRYSGRRTITTDSYLGGYRLRENVRKIETYDMNNGSDYSQAVDFTSTNNIWTETTNFDNAAYDAHWGAEVTYDYYKNTHGRLSFDGLGSTMKSYIHYDYEYDNAFWDGERMTYGDGSNAPGGFTPVTSLDVVGHEFTHGVTDFSAGLIYEGESGALNESFSDIFGTLIEFSGKPSEANYLIGEEIGFDGDPLRSMNNPNLFESPDTYRGDFWDAGGSVHTNSGVGNFWFYLICEGGNGTNDNGDNYSISPIGKAKAAQIAYRNLSVYLTPSSDYSDARFYAIKSAIDLFGPCSPEVETVTNAWYAVGVGTPYINEVTADFIADKTLLCEAPGTVSFNNLSNNATSFTWNFGDGTTSIEESPTHTYQTTGRFTVTLTANGGVCGNNRIVKNNYIEINPNAVCIVTMPTFGTGSLQTNCNGVLYDDGGPTEDYSNGSSGKITIQPTSANAVLLKFNSFDFEENFDFINIYDGPSTASDPIGLYTGFNLPENGEFVISTGSSITIEQNTDESFTYNGFELEWSCLTDLSEPIALFEAFITKSCDGTIQFYDRSRNNPISWNWQFGDGTTSTLQNPLKQYLANGIYSITLTVCNSNSCDILVIENYIEVNFDSACEVFMPSTGSGPVQTSCEGILKDDGGDENYNDLTNSNITISPSDPNVRSVILEFSIFDLENEYDYVNIYDGPNLTSPLIGRFSGSILPEGGTIRSSGRSITIQQISDRSVNFEGFQCSWSCNTSDDSTNDFYRIPNNEIEIITECEGIIKDNGGDLNYTNNTNGGFTISPGHGGHIALLFNSFNFEEDYDFLLIYDGPSTASPLIGSFSGENLPQNGTILSTGENITIIQITDESINRDGFACAFECREGSSNTSNEVLIPSSGMGIIQTSCEGILKDSGGDLNYGNSTNGSITISPPNANNVYLSFSQFSFEDDYDFLTIYDGPNTSSPLIGIYTGFNLPNGGIVYSSGSSITLQQSSDNSVNESGFELEWSCNAPPIIISIPSVGNGPIQTDCAGTLKDSGGDLNYRNNTGGSITISPSNAFRVVLEFSDFEFENNYDLLTIYDGPNNNSPIIGVYSGFNLPNGGTIISTGPSITIQQDTDESNTNRGFELSWSCITLQQEEVIMPSNGNGPILTNCEGTLKDSGGDLDYTVNTLSSITIAPNGAAYIALNFTEFSFENNFDHLTIYDGPTTNSPVIGRYTGFNFPNGGIVYSSGSSITLQQSSDDSVNESGFELEWSCELITLNSEIFMPSAGNGPIQTDCEGTLTDNRAEHNNENNPSLITIAPTGGEFVSLYFTEFSLNESEILTLYDGFTTNARIIGTFTGSELPNGSIINSSGPAITVSKTGNSFQNNSGFELIWNCSSSNFENKVNFNLAKFSIYPNPTDGIFTIQAPKNTYNDVSLVLTNSLGVIVLEELVDFGTDKSKQYNIEYLPRGMYYLLLKYGNSSEVFKIILN